MSNAEQVRAPSEQAICLKSKEVYRRSRRVLVRVGGYAVASLAFAYAGMFFTLPEGVSLWFPPAALHLLLPWLFGPAYALAIVPVGLVISLVFLQLPLTIVTGTPLQLFIAAGYGVAALVLRRHWPPDVYLRRLREVALYVLVVVVASLFIASTAAGYLVAVGAVMRARVGVVALSWWVGDLMGILTLTPFLLVHVVPHLIGSVPQGETAVISQGWAREHWRWPLQEVLGEGLWQIILFIVLATPIFFWSDTADPLFVSLLFLPLIWVSLRRGLPGAVIGILVINIGVIGVLCFYYTGLDPLHLQWFLLLFSLTGLFLGTVVTEREQATVQLQWQAHLLNSVRESVVATDTEGQVLFWGKGAEGLYGYRADEVIGRSLGFIVEPNAKTEELARIETVLNEGAWQGQYWQRHRDGSRFLADTRISLVRDEMGQTLGLIGIDRDITAQHEAVDAARHYAQQLRALHDVSITLAAQLSDLDGLLRAIVAHAIKLLDVQVGGMHLYRPELDVLEWSIVIDPDGVLPEPGGRVARGQGLAGRVWELGQIMVVNDYRNWSGRLERFADSEWQSMIAAPMQGGGEFLGVLVLMAGEPHHYTDADKRLLSMFATQAAIAIHNARLYEKLCHYAAELETRVAERTRDLAEANERLRTLDRLKSRFVSEVSHELRTPVTNLILYLDLIKRGRRKEHYLQALRSQAERLHRLIEDILDISRLDLTKDRLEFKPVDLNQIIADVIRSERARAEEQEVAFVFTSQPHLPVVQAEQERLQQVVANLIINAFNYTTEGRVVVRTFWDEEKAQVGVSVSDTGIGIANDDLPYIFDRFYRGQQVSQFTVPGTGLGLAICKEIVELHGGEIEVESQVGRGTTCTVRLPAVEMRPL